MFSNVYVPAIKTADGRILLLLKGGKGSGHFGHIGRKGKRGGSVKRQRCNINAYGVPVDRVTEFGEVSNDDIENALRKISNMGPIKNIIENVEARLSSNQRGKIRSNKARDKSVKNGFKAEEHFGIASKIDKAWKWSALLMRHIDRDMKIDFVIGRYISAVSSKGKDCFALISTKEGKSGNTIYSIELMTRKTLDERMSELRDEANKRLDTLKEIVDGGGINRPKTLQSLYARLNAGDEKGGNLANDARRNTTLNPTVGTYPKKIGRLSLRKIIAKLSDAVK